MNEKDPFQAEPIGIVNGREIWTTKSIPECENRRCPFCNRQGTPKYISDDIRMGEWYCGSEECTVFYLLSVS